MCLNVATSLSVESCFIDYKISVSCFSDKAPQKITCVSANPTDPNIIVSPSQHVFVLKPYNAACLINGKATISIL
jgi:hypothetical protein